GDAQHSECRTSGRETGEAAISSQRAKGQGPRAKGRTLLERGPRSAADMQTKIPCTLMRGGTSKGAYFLASDVPEDAATRDRVLLAVMGSPDPRQIDGVGGADPLTSKVAIVSKSTRPGIDVDYLFCQVWVDKAEV